jgi:hypothetical protein
MNPETTGSAQRPAQKTSVDMPYAFGRPLTTYLAPRQIVRLTILRSKLRDTGAEIGPIRNLNGF